MAVTQEEYDEIALQVQQQIQQDQQTGQNYQSLYNQQKVNETTLVSQTNPRPLIEELTHKLRGEIPEFGKDGQILKWYRPEGIKPMLNERGIYSILVDVDTLTNQGTILSNLDDQKVANITQRLAMTIIKKIAINWKEFDCEKSNMETVCFAIIDMSHMALLRGMDQGERNFIKNVGRYTEHITMGQQPQMLMKKKKHLLNPATWF